MILKYIGVFYPRKYYLFSGYFRHAFVPYFCIPETLPQRKKTLEMNVSRRVQCHIARYPVFYSTPNSR